MLVKPLLDLLIHVDAATSFQALLRRSEFHHWSLRLCRHLALPNNQRSQSIDWSIDEFQPLPRYLWHCIRMSSLTASCPKNHTDSDTSDCVWKMLYNSTDKNPTPFHAEDSVWLVTLVRNIRIGSDAEAWYNAERIANCLSLLCEVPNVAFRHDHRPDFFATLSWSMRHPFSHLRQAGLRLVRTLLGHQRDVNEHLLRSLVHHVGGIEEFAAMLDASSPFVDHREVNWGPESYLWILAYLDILSALTMHPEWVRHVTNHVQGCIPFILFLGSNSGQTRWFMLSTDTDLRHLCMGWDADNRPWKQTHNAWTPPGSPSQAAVSSRAPSPRIRNTYTRDIWHRLVLVLAHSASASAQPPHYTYGEQALAAKLLVACTAWLIHDTHPLRSPASVPKFVVFCRETVAETTMEVIREYREYVRYACAQLRGTPVENLNLKLDDETRSALCVVLEERLAMANSDSEAKRDAERDVSELQAEEDAMTPRASEINRSFLPPDFVPSPPSSSSSESLRAMS